MTSSRASPHRVALLVLPGVVPFDLALALEVFGRAEVEPGRPAYAVTVCGEQATVDVGAFTLGVKHGLAALRRAETLIVPGIEDAGSIVSATVKRALVAAAARGARIASICSGAFVLAQAGLLDGQRATTHWLAAPLLAQRHPAVEVDARVLFVDNGGILTSAGAAAGLDLCLHMVRKDFGAAVAARVARLSVVPLQREGGQAQFIEPMDLPPDRGLQPVVEWATRNLHRPLSMDDLAREARSSPRTLHRRFREQFGMAPVQWLIHARVRRAQELLEGSRLSVEQIVEAVGLGSAANFRAQFSRITGVSPSEHRRHFGARAPGRQAFSVPSAENL